MKRLSEITYINEASEKTIIDLMLNALKEEFNAWYGYLIVKEWITGPERTNVVKFFEETAKDELEDHAYWLMKRINQLGGDTSEISASPGSWSTAKHKYITPPWKENGIVDVKTIIQINIANEEGAIETYEELIKVTEDVDPASNAKLKEILTDEQEHLQELKDFLADIEK